VKRIVGRHGGRDWAESTPGDGATFFYTLGEYAPHFNCTPRAPCSFRSHPLPLSHPEESRNT